MVHLKSVCACALLVVFVGCVEADSQPQTVSVEQFDAWMAEVSNWGRWGEDDELGTLNLITPEKRKAAAALVEDGITVSLARDLDKVKGDLNPNPFEHELSVLEMDGHQAAVDKYAVDYLGYAHSHIDGLNHFAFNGELYNGVSMDTLKPGGAEKLGIEKVHQGIFSRGVLVDIPWLRGVDYLEPGTVILAEDLEAWEAKTGVRIGSGDVLLVRTGRWERIRQQGPWDFTQAAAGMHASVAKWLRARDVAVLGCDGISDVLPSNVDTKPNALHELVMAGIGMLIMDNLDLDALAVAVARRERPAFLFVAAPLRVPGGTGSPLNPLAVF